MARVTGDEAPANKSRKRRAGGMRAGCAHGAGVRGGAGQGDSGGTAAEDGGA